MADNVIKKVVDMRKGKTAILPSIVTNPELTGEEESLKSVEINGKTFTIGGGDGQLKLVATVTAIGEETSTNIQFNLDKPLEKGKSYVLILKDEAGTNNVCSTILTTMSSNSCISYILGCAISYETDGPTEAVYWTQNENDLYYSIEIYSLNGEDLYNNGEVLEVYELPLTFNEEPKVDKSHKHELVCSVDITESNQSIFLPINFENSLYVIEHDSDNYSSTATLIYFSSDGYSYPTNIYNASGSVCDSLAINNLSNRSELIIYKDDVVKNFDTGTINVYKITNG